MSERDGWHTAKLKVPTAPTFIILNIPGLVPGNIGENPKILVSDLSDAQKDWLAAEWRKALDAVSERQKATALAAREDTP